MVIESRHYVINNKTYLTLALGCARLGRVSHSSICSEHLGLEGATLMLVIETVTQHTTHPATDQDNRITVIRTYIDVEGRL
jgi:hypothetical protein